MMGSTDKAHARDPLIKELDNLSNKKSKSYSYTKLLCVGYSLH